MTETAPIAVAQPPSSPLPGSTGNSLQPSNLSPEQAVAQLEAVKVQLLSDLKVQLGIPSSETPTILVNQNVSDIGPDSDLKKLLELLIKSGPKKANISRGPTNTFTLELGSLSLKLPLSITSGSEGAAIGAAVGIETTIETRIPVTVSLTLNQNQAELKISLNSLTTTSAAAPGVEESLQKVFQNLLKQVTPKLSLESLRELLKPSPTVVPNPSSLAQAKAPQADLLPQLKTLLTIKAFESPAALKEILKQSLNLQPQQMSSPKVSFTESPKAAPLTTEVTQSIKHITEKISSIIKTLSSSEILAPAIQTKTLAVIAKLQETISQPIFLERFGSEQFFSLENKTSTITALLTKLGNSSLGEKATQSNTKEAQAVLKELQQILRQLATSDITSESSNKEILKGYAPLQTRTGEETKRTPAKLAVQIEQFIQGQDSLRRLNPLMQQMGEPIFLLIPGLMQGFLQHLEVSVLPKNGEEESKQGQAGQYQRVSACYDFPFIGGIKIDIAYSSSHLLLSFTSEDENIAEFIDENLHLLQEPLKSMSFKRLELISRTAEKIIPNRPDWLEEVLGVKAIA